MCQKRIVCFVQQMTDLKISLSERIKRLGYSRQTQVKLYGAVFELVSDPVVMGDQLVFIDRIEKTTGSLRRIRIPLPIVLVAKQAT
jgi:hypothetical protein